MIAAGKSLKLTYPPVASMHAAKGSRRIKLDFTFPGNVRSQLTDVHVDTRSVVPTRECAQAGARRLAVDGVRRGEERRGASVGRRCGGQDKWRQ